MQRDPLDTPCVSNETILANALRWLGCGDYSMAAGKASMAFPTAESPFDPPNDLENGTGDCIALALHSAGINRFNSAFFPDTARWGKQHGKLPAHCIYGQDKGPGWINCDSILMPNVVFREVPQPQVMPGDIVVYGSRVVKGLRIPGHIGIIQRVWFDQAAQTITGVMAVHLNATDNCVGLSRFPRPKNTAIHYLRGYNNTRGVS